MSALMAIVASFVGAGFKPALTEKEKAGAQVTGRESKKKE
jgi:hypothetical protein